MTTDLDEIQKENRRSKNLARRTRILHAAAVFFKFFILSIAILSLPVVGLFIYLEQAEKKSLEVAGEDRADEIADTFHSGIRSLGIDVVLLSKSPALTRFIESGDEESRRAVEQTFENAMRSWKSFAQVRYLDASGMERVRVDRVDSDIKTIPIDALQDKGSRAYFTDAASLPKGQLYVSRLDLNVEQGKIEEPWKPMIRIATPLFDAADNRAGAFIINVRADYLLNVIAQSNNTTDGTHKLQLLAEDGSWLSGAPKEKLWDFMFQNGHTAAAEAPEMWAYISSRETGTFWDGNQQYSFATVRPNGQFGIRSDMDQTKVITASPVSYWKVVNVRTRPTPPLYAQPLSWAVIALIVALVALLSLAWSRSVHHRREAERKERNAILQNREVLNQTDSVVCIADLDGKVLFANDKYRRLSGKPANDLIGTQEMLISRADGSKSPFWESPTATVIDKEIEIEASDGHHSFLKNRFPLHDSDGVADAICIIATDITQLKNVEKSLEAAREDAVEASQAKSRFVANMSHELRTPLNAIIGYAEILAEEAEDDGLDTYRDDVQRILDSGEHLLSLINDILDLSKIEAGQMELHVETFALDDVMRSVLSAASPLMKKNGNAFNVDADCERIILTSDSTRLRQILINLLGNAAKFTKEGTVSLSLRQEDDGDTLFFDITDTGIGMTPDQLSGLFQEFAQADSSITKRFQGTGLGLAICKRLASLLEGDISVVSEEGKGSTFTLRIPRTVSQSDQSQSAASAPVNQPTAQPASRDQSSACILVIDDDPDSRELLARHITSQGMQVVTASNGADGVERAKSLKPDAITLDVFMESMSGIDVLEALKADPETRQIPVIMCTISDTRETCMSLGAVDFLTKPINRTDYLKAIGCHIGEREDATVLIVDDLEDNRNVMKRHLDDLGYRTLEARDGLEALNTLSAGNPVDCVLLDIAMPGMDGFEFLKQFNERPEWRNIPVIVITALSLSENERAQLLSSVQDVVCRGETLIDDVLDDIISDIGKKLRSAA